MAKHAVLSSASHLWRSIRCAKSELSLDLTLACGQSFRWRQTAEGHWTGVMSGHVWTLTQTDDTLWYHVYTKQDKKTTGQERKISVSDAVKKEETGETGEGVKDAVKKEKERRSVGASGRSSEEEMLRDYFQLDVKLGDLYSKWGAADCHFKHIADIFTGVRMLRQDPTECLFSFICTSNNHISRIQGMVERLCQALGTPLCHLDQTSYHDFPTLSALADSRVEARLRDLGFGYRARFLQQSAAQILDTHGPRWLQGLRSVPYQQACDALRTLPGVGIKVANCVCLMALDKSEAVPIDTHVWQIAKRDYNFAAGKEQKTITDKLHKDIGDFFRELWGPYAGWAHSVLFCADLKKFQSLKEESSVQQLKRERGSSARGKQIKREHNETVTLKTHKKTKLSIKKEKGT
ncbi:N-glycosylase/DNA lyase isoform X1 [Gouania willdenowi]|nr:N-glycosylase/DNA lyase isoform X1 [Gouania willdenowi]